MLAKLERKLGWLAIPNLTLFLVGGQALGYAIALTQPDLLEQFLLVPSRVLEGEVWRLFVFLIMPPVTAGGALGVIFLFFALYLLYLMGTALENHWGAFRYNLYLLIAYLATLGAAWVEPGSPSTNLFIDTSVFLAFAFLYPDFVLHIFLVLPVKVKWIALITWLGYGFVMLAGDWLTRALVLASTLNFGLFFGRDLVQMAARGRRRVKQRAERAAVSDEAFHRCVVCRRTERSHPQLEFRYCPQCVGSPCYCAEHIHAHEHRVAKTEARSRAAR